MVDCKTLLPDPSNQTAGNIANTLFNPYRTNSRTKPIDPSTRDFTKEKSSIIYYCPKADSMIVQGSETSKKHQYVQISFKGCDES